MAETKRHSVELKDKTFKLLQRCSKNGMMTNDECIYQALSRIRK